MLEKSRYYHLLLLIAVNSPEFAQAQVEPREQVTALFSKLPEIFKSSGVATLSVGPVWEGAGNTQTFYLAPNIEKIYAANHASHALVDGEIFFGIQKSLREKLELFYHT